MSFSALLAVALIGQASQTPHSEVSLISSVSKFQSGAPFWAAVRFKIEKDWHIYWTNPGDTGEPTNIKWQVPTGWKVEPQRWLPPKKVLTGDIVSYAYESEALFLAKITPPAKAKAGDIKVSATWLICKDVCLKASKELKLSLQPAAKAAVNKSGADLIQKARTQLPASASGWTFSARRQNGAVIFKGGHPSMTVNPAGAYFYSSEPAVLDHGAAQTFRPASKSFSVQLTESEFASAPAKRLRGVLVPPAGKTWPKGTKSLYIDIPIQ